MADVRTFKAASMQEALDIVRREMGPEAVILHTRETPRSKLFSWMQARERVEITAGLGVNIRPPAVRPSTPRPPAAEVRTSPRETAPADRDLAPPPPLLAERRPAPPRPAAPSSALPAPRPRPVAAAQAAPPAPALTRPAPPLKRPVTPAPRPVHATALETPLAPLPAPAPVAAPPLAETHSEISQQLSSIRQMVENLSRHTTGSRREEIPGDLFDLYTELIDAEVDEDLARDLVFRLKRHSGPDQLRDPAAARRLLASMVEDDVRCARPITVTPGRRKVVALVGPTGVGKTTTIAKLAANFRLREGVRMGLVTVDTYRIAAVEQLRTYAEIIDLPMKVVTSPREMRRALDELAGLDLVLIDTAGRSPRDELKIQELKSLLAEARVDEVHLVMSLAASARSLATTAEKFASAGTTAMILTKLDEAPGLGALLSVSRKVSLPVSYLTTGQNVPDDIEAAAASRIARLVLGTDQVFSKPSRSGLENRE